MSNKIIDWLFDTQKQNGSWGILDGTSEETAYAVQALTYYHINVEKLDTVPIASGVKFLLENYENNDYPELWIGKGLYTPINVVKSAVISALYMYHSKIQHLPEST